MGSVEIVGDITPAPNILSYSRFTDRLSRLRHWTSELKLAYNSLNARQSEEGTRIFHQLELILVDRLRRQGIRSPDVLETTKLIHANLANFNQEGQKLRARLLDAYAKEATPSLRDKDPRRQLNSLHLAASLDDTPAVKLFLAAGLQARTEVVEPATPSVSRTPLELYVLYTDIKPGESVECPRTLLEADRSQRTQLAFLIAASRGQKPVLELLQSRYPAMFKAHWVAYARLAIAYGHTEIVDWILGKASLPLPSSTQAQTATVQDPLDGPISQFELRRAFKPWLEDPIKGIEVARLLKLQHPANHSGDRDPSKNYRAQPLITIQIPRTLTLL
jgi:hypothetical protein